MLLSELDRVARADRAAGVADRRGHAPDRARTARHLHAQAQRVLGARSGHQGQGYDPSVAPQLFLIDGNSLVYRAFFALPDSIATSKGEPTNAIFGFASMLVKLLTEYGSNPTLVVWDAGWSGREEVYTEYKAERRSRPDLLREQWPALEPLVEAFGYRNVRAAGYEADDVIASLATQ